MNQSQKAQYEARVKIIKAIAHPSRLFIIEELNRRERCVNELAEMVGADISTVSKHLSILKNAGLVFDEKRGTNICYRLRTQCILNFIGCVEDVLTANAQSQMEILRCCKK